MFIGLNKTTQKAWMLQEENRAGKHKKLSNKCVLVQMINI
jgi:hypothetical protein